MCKDAQMLEWGDLRFLLALARSRSLSGAARSLGVEHTTVSRRLASIEAALGARLFDRTPDGHVASAAGQRALAHAQAIEAHALALEREVTGMDARVSGTVRITALDAFIDDFLLPNLPVLQRKHPDLLIVATPEARVVSLARREADVAIRYYTPTDPDFVARKLADVASAVYASRSYIERRGRPRTAADLDGHDRVAYAPELAHASEERWLVDHAAGARIALQVGSPGAYRAALQAGIGIGIYECHSADRDPDLVRLWREPVLMEHWWAVVHVEIARAARIRAVMGFLSEVAASNRDRLAGIRSRRARRSRPKP